MKKQFALFLFITFSLLGCSKSQRVINKLEGEWEIVTYRQTYINGLTSEIPSEGTFLFGDYTEKKERKGVYECNQSYTVNGTVNYLSENGTYHANERGDHLFVTVIKPDGSSQNERDCSINILTTSDLKFQVVFNDVFHTYVLRKK